jgi:hypothetical protein
MNGESEVGPFRLAPEIPSGKRRFSDAQLMELGEMYRADVTPRSMRRWIARGKQVDEHCPIESPALLKAWWAKHMTHSVPDWLMRAAAVAQAPVSAPVAAQPPPASESPAPPPAVASVNIDDFELGEGEAVRQQRSLVALLWSQLKQAYLTPGVDVDMLQSKYNKATESLRRLEKDDREDRKSRGLLIPRSVVQRDIEAACELIRQMSETEKRRVLELCPTLGPAERAEVAAAIERICEVRTRVFRSLKSLKETDDALRLIAAA